MAIETSRESGAPAPNADASTAVEDAEVQRDGTIPMRAADGSTQTNESDAEHAQDAEPTSDSRVPADGSKELDASFSPDAPEPVDAGSDGASLDAVATYAPCDQGTNVFSVFVSGSYAGQPAGPAMLTEQGGSWLSSFDPNWQLTLGSGGTNPSWYFTAASRGEDAGGLAVGLFVCDGTGANNYAGLSVNGHACTADPAGSFTIEQLVTGGNNGQGELALIQFKASFALTCGDAGTVSGCINYHTM